MEQKPTRRYNAARRQVQARQTRSQITEAARRLFVERSYTGATMEAIAQDAGVAVETVYAVFGSKKNILIHLVDVSVVGDDEPVPLLERPGPQAVQTETNPANQVRMFARDMRQIMTRMAPIFEILRTAAKIEPEIADLRARILQDRLQGMAFFVRALISRTKLREGLDPGRAAEIVWVISSGETFSLLTNDLGWSGELYETWLADSLARLLLPGD